MAARSQIIKVAVILTLILVASQLNASAEKLPIKIYTTSDGLAPDQINRIVRDSRGFLWFCTKEGLARFNGYEFTAYGQGDGLPNRNVSDLLETREGVYWIATGSGVCRFNPVSPHTRTNPPSDIGRLPDLTAASEPRFVSYPLNENGRSHNVNVMIEDRSGTIWCGTGNGLYRLEQINGVWAFSFVDIGVRSVNYFDAAIHDLLEDSRGILWIGAVAGLYRRSPDGRAEHCISQDGVPYGSTGTLLEDKEGRLWAGGSKGLSQVMRGREFGQPLSSREYTTKDGLSNGFIAALHQSSDGRLWVGTNRGLDEFIPEADGAARRFHNYTIGQGMGKEVKTLAEDPDGNIWIGTARGAMKMARNGLISYDEADGFGNTRIASIFEDLAGELCVIDDRGFINRFEGDRFSPIRPNLPRNIKFSWGWYQTHFQDRTGKWWVPTLEGLFLYPKLSRVEQLAGAKPQAVYTTRDGLSGNEIFRVYEDSRGDVWVGNLGDPKTTLTRWERATATFHRYSPADKVPESTPSAFCEDASGNVWIGFYGGGVVRYSAGRFTPLTTAEGLPAGFIRGLYLDGKNRLWVSTTQGGLGRVDDPGSDQPHFVNYTAAEGLSSNHVTCVTEDQWGRIYVGTARGLDRLEPATGRITHYTVADGLADSFVQVAYRDRNGALWFGTYQGLTRVIPEPEHVRPPAPVFISGLRVAGSAFPVPDLGATEIRPMELSPIQNHIEIDFFGLSFSPGERLRYQYKLEGSDKNWRPLTLQRTVNYASLPPGVYRFVVQAVNPDGTLSESPATVAFSILPPIWRRWWFFALVALLILGLVFGFDRYRVARVKEVEAALTQSTVLARQLAVQQEHLKKANRTLALDYAVTNILGESANLNDAAPRILKAICESTGWEIGELWDADPRAGVLRCVDVFHMEMKDAAEFERQSKQITFLPGVGLPGRVLANAEPLWIADLAVDRNFPRVEFAVKEGLRSAFGFPILLGKEVLGVLEFFSRETREPDRELLEGMSTIGSHFGQLLERKRGEQKLRESESRFRTLAETAADAIITIDEESTIIYVNRAAEKVFGHSAEDMLGRDLTMLMPEYLRHLHKAGLARYAGTGSRHIAWEAVELPGLHKDGREIPLELSFGEFTRNEQRLFTGIARDITERKRAEEALRKSREERLVELEHVRRRIATDLHDDIGSSLSQIFLLSEVARQRIGPDDAPVREPLSMIANASHELVGSMSDIVWAINPQKDHLSDLVQRMRRFASEVLEARNIELRFRAPGSEQDVRVGASIRREVFLVFKESVNNLARHSHCREADIEFSLEDDVLALKLSDDGRGFDPSRENDGHGLVSMRERARAIGGRFELTSAPNKGTTITLQVPLDQPNSNSQTMTT